ncbi:MAG: alpha/beta hydrolase [bacterium]|nr:alpha/beta hydrolase [bacterium]
MKQQIVLIHGGNTYKTYREYLSFLKKKKIDFERYKNAKSDWKKTLGGKLGKKFEVISLDMPNKANAKYAEWKIWFEKFIPYIKTGVILVGHSLGGIFLAKYLSENKFSKKIRAVFLVAAPYDTEDTGESLADFILPKKLSKLSQAAENIFIYQSQDDPVVLFVNALKYKKALPQAKMRIFKNRGHFNQASFPEMIKEIKKLL